MNTTMAELSVNSNLRPMESSPWVGSLWFYVLLTFAVIITFGFSIMNRKTSKKVGYMCRGCWSVCRRRGGDR